MGPATARKAFINLAVEDLDRSVAFFTKLGFGFDPQMTDETATAMILNDETYVMLLSRDFFSTFTTKELADPRSHTEVIVALSAGSREEVDSLVADALAAGGQPSNEPMDQGFMYGSSFQDPDGHLWEVVWMDPSAAP